MKNSVVAHCISFELLRFIRDGAPTESELLFWFGEARKGCFHTLRKAGLLDLADGIVRLSPNHLSADGKRFHWDNSLYHIDEGRRDVY